MKRFVLGLLLAIPLWAQTISNSIENVLNSSAAAQRTFWGIQIVDLSTGATVFALNADKPFIPASNTKLLTTALALTRLGPDYRVATTVVAAAAPDSDGVIHSDVRLVGAGDPNLSARVFPYAKKEEMGPDPLLSVEDLAAQLAAKGVRKIEGAIVGDDTAFAYEPYPEGWSVDDPLYEYGAPVSALTLDDNTVSVTLHPASHTGDAPPFLVSPETGELNITNRVRTAAQGATEIELERLPGSRDLVMSGQIARHAKPYTFRTAVDDPAAFAARALRNELIKQGITVVGSAVARHRVGGDLSAETPGFELARHMSYPLLDDLRVIDKESQNLHAELALMTVARSRHQPATRKLALEEMKAFLEEVGVEPSGFFLRDGSGLSRMTLVSPAAFAKVLLYMYRSRNREAWVSLLPVGGDDGTLRNRFKDASPEGLTVHAKTGSISHVAALSGYVLPESGAAYAFSIIANNANAPAAEIRAVIDKIVLILVHGV